MDKPFITIGYHKGEMDFGVNGSIMDLNRTQMKDLREMLCVAIHQAESMWSRGVENRNPTCSAEHIK